MQLDQLGIVEVSREAMTGASLPHIWYLAPGSATGGHRLKRNGLTKAVDFGLNDSHVRRIGGRLTLRLFAPRVFQEFEANADKRGGHKC